MEQRDATPPAAPATVRAHDATTRGVVAAGHPATVDAAIATLRAGGNAYDAAVAAGFAAAMAEPCLSSLGGGGFLLARTAAGEETVFDFFVDTPGRGRAGPQPQLTPVTLRFGSAEQVFHVGHGSVAVPGCLEGYLRVHARLGRLELDAVLAPARRLAHDGVVLGPEQAAVVRLLRPIFATTPEGRAAFVPRDRDFADDDRYRNPALGDLLDELADGRVAGFADPQVAAAIDADMRAHSGALTAADLRAYEVVERRPLVVEVAGARLLTNPPPSYGGTLVASAIARLEADGAAGPAGSGPRLVQLADVLEQVARTHAGDRGDDGHTGRAGHAGRSGHAGEAPGAGSVAGSTAVPGSAPPAVDATEQVDPDPRDQRAPRTAKGTTHISVVDAEGNLAAMTTSNGSGSGVILGDTGVFANNVMGEADLHPHGFHVDPPGRRVGSMMAPSVLLRAGEPAVVLGSGGSERIRSALTQVLACLLDDRMTLTDAVRSPRIHWDGTRVQAEPGFAEQALATLAAARASNVWDATDLYFGGVHAVDAAGEAVGDHRRGGCTGSLDR